MRIALALIPLLILAGCGGGDAGDNSAAPVTAASPPVGQQWTDVVAATPEGGVRQGNPNAPIKLVEYGSRTCPTCMRFALEGVEPLRQKYISTGRVSYEFREFFVHPQDLGVALIGRCVSTEAFFPVLDQMYARQTELGANAEQVYQTIDPRGAPLDMAKAWAHGLGYVNLIKQVGISEERANQCLSDTKALEALSNQIKAASEKGVSGTPTFFINDRVVDGPTWAAVEPRLQAAGAR